MTRPPVSPTSSTRELDDLRAAVATLVLDHHVADPTSIDLEATTTGIVSALLAAAPLTTVLAAVAAELGTTFVDLDDPQNTLTIDAALVDRAGAERLAAIGALPMRDPAGRPVFVAVNPFDPDVIDVSRATVGPVQHTLALGLAAQIHDELTILGSGRVHVDTDTDRTGPVERRQVLDWSSSLLQRAAAERASDIHIQFDRKGRLRIRFRVDGQMRTGPDAPEGRESEIVGALMNRAGMDVANLLVPQDGTFSFVSAGRSIDCRASMLPQDTGASLVLRLLDPAIARLRIDQMGMTPAVVATLKRLVHAPAGTIITSGPTGSGKTTTMYALLRELDADRMNITTIEDPIEYRIDGIGQTQVRHDLGDKTLSFARALRAILRHDPDAILVGEVRDAESATIAMEAAITGHLVLTTVHAPSAVAVFARLVQMGVAPYMVADGLSGVLGQRLVRRVHGCARLEAPTSHERALIQSWGRPVPELVPHTVGCDACHHTGFLGRALVVELLEPDARLRELVLEGVTQAELDDHARSIGFVPLLDDGLRLVAAGLVTVDEVARSLAAEGRAA